MCRPGLLPARADMCEVRVQCRNHQTWSHFSSAFGNPQVNYLAEACAQVSWEILPCPVRAAVEMSLSCGCCSAVSSVVSRVHVVRSVHQRACRCREIFLIARLARSTNVIDLPNDKLQTPLHFAAFYQHPRATWQQSLHFTLQDVL